MHIFSFNIRKRSDCLLRASLRNKRCRAPVFEEERKKKMGFSKMDFVFESKAKKKKIGPKMRF